jgi:hypothetical protein
LGFLAWWASWYTDLSLVEDALGYEILGTRIALEWIADGTSPTLQSIMTGGRQAWGMVFLLAAISFLLRGGALYKEGLVLFVLSMIVYHVLVLQEHFRPRSILMVVLAIAALTSVRFYLAAVLLPSIVLGLLLSHRRKSQGEYDAETPASTVMRRLVVLGALIVLLVVSGTTVGILEILPDSSREFFGQVQASRDDLAAASSGYLRGTDVSNPRAALKFLPLGIFYFLTVPLPWQFGSLRQNLVIPEMIFWLLQYPRIFRGMKLGLRRNFRGSLVLISITLAMICLYGLFVSNVGTAYRMRAQVWLFWTLFAGWRKEETLSAHQDERSDRNTGPG